MVGQSAEFQHQTQLNVQDQIAELRKQREMLDARMAELSVEFDNDLALSELDHAQDMEKILLDGAVGSRYSPGRDTIEGD